jgi:hypothetical protein
MGGGNWRHDYGPSITRVIGQIEDGLGSGQMEAGPGMFGLRRWARKADGVKEAPNAESCHALFSGQ